MKTIHTTKVMTFFLALIIALSSTIPVAAKEVKIFLPLITLGATATNVTTAVSEVQEDCPTCSNAADAEEEALFFIVAANSDEYKSSVEAVEASFDFTAVSTDIGDMDAIMRDARVSAIRSAPQAVVSYQILNAEDGLTAVNFWVDYEHNEIGLVQKYYAKQITRDVVNIRVVMNDVNMIDVNVNSEGNVIKDDGSTIGYEEFIDHLQEENAELPIRASGLCEWAMAALCGAGAGAGCYALCGVAAIVNVLGGLGCAVACGLIGGLGCTGATIAVCG